MESKTITRREMEKGYNKVRYEILEGHETLIIADHQKGKLYHYKFEEVEECDTHDKIDNAYLTNGWKHRKQLEDNLND